jgi:hypothetical protein
MRNLDQARASRATRCQPEPQYQHQPQQQQQYEPQQQYSLPDVYEDPISHFQHRAHQAEARQGAVENYLHTKDFWDNITASENWRAVRLAPITTKPPSTSKPAECRSSISSFLIGPTRLRS